MSVIISDCHFFIPHDLGDVRMTGGKRGGKWGVWLNFPRISSFFFLF